MGARNNDSSPSQSAKTVVDREADEQGTVKISQETWHRRLGHLNARSMTLLRQESK